MLQRVEMRREDWPGFSEPAAVVVIFVLSMFLTPADPISMLLMAGPLCFLYVTGILFCKYMPGNKNPFAAGYDP